MIKLKTILKEGKVWERKFGEPLPTLNSVMEKHQQNQLNENEVSVLKPAVKRAKSTLYGYINLKYHYAPLRKALNELLSIINKIDYVAIDFDDREDIKPVYDLGHWKPPFIREPLSKSIKKLSNALSNPKNFKEPNRVKDAVPSRLGSVLFPKYKQAVKAYKRFEKFNNKKISSVFPESKGTKLGNRLVGSFGGFRLLQDVSKLLNNEGGFQLQQSLKDSIRDMDYLTNKRNQKREVVGANK
jgi:hypothetical protein